MTTSDQSSPSTNLIARIASRGLEDSATEVLAEILRQPAAQATFAERVLKAPLGGHATVDTQVTNIHTSGRPDLRLTTPSRVVLVEAKIWAKLQEQQLQRYVSELQHNLRDPQEGTLLLLVPGSRKAELWESACKELHGKSAEHEKIEVGGRITVRLTTWTEVVDVLRTAVIDEPRSRWLVDSLGALVRAHINPRGGRLLPAHMRALQDDATLNSIIALGTFIYELVGKLAEQGFHTRTPRAGLNYYGFNAEPKGEATQSFWLGYFHQATVDCKMIDKCPLWMQLTGVAFDGPCLGRIEKAGYKVVEVRDYPAWTTWGGRIVALPLDQSNDADEAIALALDGVKKLVSIAGRVE